MAGSGDRRPLATTAVAVLAIVCTGTLVTPVAAADDGGPLVLPGQTLAAMVADIDGDGEGEVVRTTTSAVSAERVEAWDVVDGSWTRLDAADVPVLVTEEESATGLRPPAALLRTLVDGRERLLVIVAGIEPDDEFAQVCCTEFHELGYDHRGLALRPMPASGGSADLVLPADLDGDGTDELILHHNRFESESTADTVTTRLEVLRRGPDGWSTIYESEETGHGYGLIAGETDGVSGDEIIIGPSELGEVRRLTLVDGEFATDQTSLGVSEDGGGWPSGMVDGRLLATYPDAVEIMTWPRGGAAEPYARLPSSAWPSVAVVGDDRHAVIVKHDGFEPGGSVPATTIHDLDLRRLGEVAHSPLANELWDIIGLQADSGSYSIERSVWPVTGLLPGGWVDGEPAYVANGTLVRTGGANGYSTTPMATLIGSQILGLAGPGRAWAVIGTSIYSPSEGAYLYSGVPYGQPMVALTPVDELLRPDADADVAALELRNAVEVGDGYGKSRLMAHPGGFEVVVSAAAGSVVVTTDGRNWESHDVEAEAVVVDAAPIGGASDENQDFERWVLVIRPDGIGSVDRWQGTFLREPPEVTAHAATAAFSLRSTISGRVSDGMTVTVDGASAPLNRFGAFHVEVDAPIWPRTVHVVARDPFGTERTARIEIVGFVDYRGLPWVPIVGVLTVVGGGVLFVRTPRHRPVATAVDGDGRLEEISAD